MRAAAWFSGCAAFVIVAATLLASPNFRFESGPQALPYGGDFLQEWIGGYVVRAGDPSRLYDSAYTEALQHDAAVLGFEFRPDLYIPMVYPPFYYVLVSPLSALPFMGGAWVFLGLMLACFVAAIALLRPMTRVPAPASGTPRRQRLLRLGALLALPAAVAFVPFAENLVSVQKGTLVLLIFTATLVLLRGGWELAAGLVFGLQAFKPQLAVVVPLAMLVSGHLRFAGGVLITAALLAGASYAILGATPWVDYVGFASRAGDFVRMQPDYLPRSHGLWVSSAMLAGAPSTAARLATLAGVLLVAWSVARVLRTRCDVRNECFLVQFSALVIATVLVSPHLLTYDLTLLLLPGSLLGLAALDGRLGRGGTLVLGLLAAAYVGCAVAAPIARLTRVQVTTPILLALLVALATVAAPRPVTDRESNAGR